MLREGDVSCVMRQEEEREGSRSISGTKNAGSETGEGAGAVICKARQRQGRMQKRAQLTAPRECDALLARTSSVLNALVGSGVVGVLVLPCENKSDEYAR